jgi:hypothetical protein
VRFGRVFGGLGLLLCGLGLFRWNVLPGWVGVIAMLIGVAAMALTMALPDDLQLYAPIFHVYALWLAATGIVMLRGGVNTASNAS